MKHEKRMTAAGVAVFAVVALMQGADAQSRSATDSALEQGFRNPPDSAKPRTWWHWTNGNVTKEGITKDLEWMRRVGIGGFQLVDVASGAGQTVEPKINFGTPEWYDAVKHSAMEGKRLGLEMSIFSSPGWSEAGGPWVKPQEAMKRLVWSETVVDGPRKFTGKLPQPPSNEGPVRDWVPGAGGAAARPGAAPPSPGFYADSAVIAYRTPAEATSMAALQPKVTSSEAGGGTLDGTALWDGSLNTALNLAAPKAGAPAWIQFEFAKPFTARALSLGSRGGIPVGRVLASEDGAVFRPLASFPGPQGYHGASVRTFAFPAVTARFFRVELTGAPLRPGAVIEGGLVLPATAFSLSEAVLFSDARVHRWEDKGAFGSLMDVYESVPTPPAESGASIQRASVVNLTAKAGKDGTVEWDVPPGRWTVLRIGYAPTGAKNRPSVPAGSGYDVDKLNPAFVEKYFHGYMDPIKQSLGPLVGDELRYMTMDSWEAGMQNWTDDMIGQFTRLRGYDPTPFLPVLTGRVVESAQVSDRFLWDFRRTLADLFSSSFYGTMEKQLKASGMGSYAEASGVALEIPEDTLLNKKEIDIPMAEFWVHALHPESMYYVDNRGAASAAHVYGKPIVASEAYTGGGYESPYTLKKIADFWFAQGVNRLVFHSTAQQPLDTKPGNTMVGTHINRNITWAEQAGPFMAYIARCEYMLQQGRSVADLAYLLPEGAPSTMPFWGAGLQPAPPKGYDYDYVNTDVLLHRISVGSDGRLTLPDSVSYRVLVLPPTGNMTLEVLRQLHTLLAAGATLVGGRPTGSPSLRDSAPAEAEMQALAQDMWGDTDGVTNTQHAFGKGMLYDGLSVSDVLKRLKTPRDFSAKQLQDNDVAWIHRHSGDAEIYFVSNQTDAPADVDAAFRVTGKQVEVWHPDTGERRSAAYENKGLLTAVPLHLAQRESVFVVLREAPQRSGASDGQEAGQPVTLQTAATLGGSWKVSFPPNLGAPAAVEMAALQSWTRSAQDGVKYFSGTATYSKEFQYPKGETLTGRRMVLDLGAVGDIAEVTLNGHSLGTLWKPPYQVDVTGVLKPGPNLLQVRVTNQWTNRLIGDRLAPEGQRVLSPGLPVRPRPAGAAPPVPPPAIAPVESAQWKNNGLAPSIPGGNGSGFSSLPSSPPEAGLIGPVTIAWTAARP